MNFGTGRRTLMFPKGNVVTSQRSFHAFDRKSFFGNLPERVKIVEVGPRDGLQNEKMTIPTDEKVKMIKLLADAGLDTIEAGAFVAAPWIPQMADSEEVMKKLDNYKGKNYPVLVPNAKGLQRAMSCGSKEIALFSAASESFSQKNTNCSIAKALERFVETSKQAKDHGIRVRGYISTVMGCPYEGKVSLNKVVELADILYNKYGCYEISLGDTIGVGTAGHTRELIRAVSTVVPVQNIAVHFHDTYGQALTNILVALQMGVRTVDSSVAGLGGCPYAKGASGNVATEEVVYMLKGLGIETGIDLEKLVQIAKFTEQLLGKPPVSKVSRAVLSKGSIPANYYD